MNTNTNHSEQEKLQLCRCYVCLRRHLQHHIWTQEACCQIAATYCLPSDSFERSCMPEVPAGSALPSAAAGACSAATRRWCCAACAASARGSTMCTPLLSSPPRPSPTRSSTCRTCWVGTKLHRSTERNNVACPCVVHSVTLPAGAQQHPLPACLMLPLQAVPVASHLACLRGGEIP
jgi:hypothetical protein